MTMENLRKKAIVFGGSDGHGITMTAISERALKAKGFDVETICRYEKNTKKDPLTHEYPRDCGTGQPEYFWGRTFPLWDFSALVPGDMVMVIDIPIPVQQQIKEYSAASAGIHAIERLCKEGIRVVLVDHHSRALTDYGKAVRAGAELIFSVGDVRYAHYGIPDDYSLFWGSIGAICDRDGSLVPLENYEKKLFAPFEGYADWLDREKVHVGKNESLHIDPLSIIRADYRKITCPENPLTVENGRIADRDNVVFIEKLIDGKGFKELDYACRVKNTPYGLGIGTNYRGQVYILVINYWKYPLPATPVALYLHRYRRMAGHNSAVTIPVPEGQNALELANRCIRLLNSKQLGESGKMSQDPDAIDYLIQAFADSRISIPEWLTIHGWPHVQNVFANVQLLGTLLNCSEEDQNILNWSALFHDLGNAALNYTDNEKENYCNLTPEYTTDSETVRKYHHILTVEILKCWREKKGFCKGKDGKPDLISDKDFEIICDLCYRHRKDPKLLPDDEHRKTLCAILRIADALDKSKDRARINDKGQLWSQVDRDLRAREQNFAKDPDDAKKAADSRKNWEGQRAIETIRLYTRPLEDKTDLLFEFLVTDAKKAEFMIEDFKKELKPLQENRIQGIESLDTRTRCVPLFP